MKWLMTHTLGGDGGKRYRLWLSQLSIGVDCVSPEDAIPRRISAYAALLLPGGVDVDPQIYGSKQAAETMEVNRRRDDQELDLIRLFLKERKPIFGVCRGIQIVNVALGGKLIQHVPAYLSRKGTRQAKEFHGQVGKKDSVHAVRFVRGSQLGKALRGIRQVNSAHHQAVDPAAVANGLRVVASSPMGIVEALEGFELPSPVVAVQWHPERLALEGDEGALRLLRLMKEVAGS